MAEAVLIRETGQSRGSSERPSRFSRENGRSASARPLLNSRPFPSLRVRSSVPEGGREPAAGLGPDENHPLNDPSSCQTALSAILSAKKIDPSLRVSIGLIRLVVETILLVRRGQVGGTIFGARLEHLPGSLMLVRSKVPTALCGDGLLHDLSRFQRIGRRLAAGLRKMLCLPSSRRTFPTDCIERMTIERLTLWM